MPKRTEVIDDFSGGMNLEDTASALDENESIYMWNVTGDRKGRLRMGASNTLRSVIGAKFHTGSLIPGENLFSMYSDYTHRGNTGTNKEGIEGCLITDPEMCFDSVSTWSEAGTNITITAGEGIIYGNGHAAPKTDYVKCTLPAGKRINPNKWYEFYMLIINKTRNSTNHPDGDLELILTDTTTPASTDFQMYPTPTHALDWAGAGGTANKGGVLIKPKKGATSSPISAVSSVDADNYTCVVAGQCKSANFTSGQEGDLYLWGHLNGTNGSPNDQWVIKQVAIREVPQDIDEDTTADKRHNTEGEIILGFGTSLIRWSGSDTYFTSGAMQRKTYDGSFGTDEDLYGAGSIETIRYDTYQADALMRFSNMEFKDAQDAWMIGPIVVDGWINARVDGAIGVLASTFNAGTTGVMSPCYINQDLRQYYSGPQDPNSVFAREYIYGNTIDNPALVLSAADPSITASDYNYLHNLCHNQAIALQVVQGGASDDDGIDSDWKKRWHFGIAYLLRDNSVTNVRHAGTMVETGTGLLWRAEILDGGWDTNRTDGVLTGKTVTWVGDGSGPYSVSDAVLYVKNKTLVGVNFPTQPNNVMINEIGTIVAAQFGGSCSLDAKILMTKRPEIESGTVDMRAWTKNPRISMAFREDVVPASLTGCESGSDAVGPYISSNYHTGWYNTARPLSVGENYRDPRVTGFYIFAYAEEDVSDTGDVPWIPIMECNIDKKTFISYTYDQVERTLNALSSLVCNQKYTGLGGVPNNTHGGKLAGLYTTGAGFDSNSTGTAAYMHNKPPQLSLTYHDRFGIRSDEDLKIRWSASCLLNGRAVIGNVFNEGSHYPDRIVVSEPGTFDTFAIQSGRDIGINDGQSIIAIEGFADKLLIFKREVLYVINFTDPDGRGLEVEGSYNHYGVDHHASVVKSDYGISWFNKKTGMLHYDGSEITNLSHGKILFNQWAPVLTGGIITRTHICPLAFEPRTKELFLRIDANKNSQGGVGAWSSNGWSYSFETQSWYFQHGFYNNETTSGATAQSNFIIDKQGKALFYRNHIAGVGPWYFAATNNTGMREINTDTRITNGSTHYAYLFTREIDFKDMTLDKIIYKIIVKYKYGSSGGVSGSGMIPSGFVNGNHGDTISFEAVDGSGDFLDDNSGIWDIWEGQPVVPLQTKNIKSFGVKILGQPSNGNPLFEVDSISIVYRLKHAK